MRMLVCKQIFLDLFRSWGTTNTDTDISDIRAASIYVKLIGQDGCVSLRILTMYDVQVMRYAGSALRTRKKPPWQKLEAARKAI